MSGTAPSGDLIEELVHQFADPFAFYRELIQNSIDAGSNRIEVVLRYEPGAQQGMAVASVQDWGEGMDRRIIEEYLITKFRSSKEGDRTKIGKFGIGFLSVFACGPELVVVETGRDGQDWRVLFFPDRSYELLRCPEPREGTLVCVHKALAANAYCEFAERSREAVSRWCRHSEVDVTFAAGTEDGSVPPRPAPVREPLTAEAVFQVEERHEQALIVAGPALADAPQSGFYNRGLTLLETREPLVPGVSFKVISNRLEHTLTRDNVRRDRGFDQVMERVRRLVKGPLRERLARELKDAAADPARGADYSRLLALALRRDSSARLDSEALHFPLAQGGSIDGRALAKAVRRAGELLLASGPSPLVAAVAVHGVPVLRDEPGLPAMLTGADITPGVQPSPVQAAWVLCTPEPRPSSTEAALAEALLGLLDTSAGGIRRVALGAFVGLTDDALAGRAPLLGGAARREHAKASPFEAAGLPLLCLRRDHPVVASALGAAVRQPRLAAYLLFRALAARNGGVDAATDRSATEAMLR